jgi:hypothetical protein
MTAREIIKKYLEDNGYDGLFYAQGECSCQLNDLMPCGEIYDMCVAGIIKGWCQTQNGTCKDFDPEKCDPDWSYCMREKEI